MVSYREATVGGTVSFSAVFRAVPSPSVKWFKDEEEVRPTDRHRVEQTPSTSTTDDSGDGQDESGTISLTIVDVRESDEGAYKCKVENREGVASTTGYLSVTGQCLQSALKYHSKNKKSRRIVGLRPPMCWTNLFSRQT